MLCLVRSITAQVGGGLNGWLNRKRQHIRPAGVKVKMANWNTARKSSNIINPSVHQSYLKGINLLPFNIWWKGYLPPLFCHAIMSLHNYLCIIAQTERVCQDDTQVAISSCKTHHLNLHTFHITSQWKGWVLITWCHYPTQIFIPLQQDLVPIDSLYRVSTFLKFYW